MNLKKRNKIYFLIAIVFIAFWFYNFRWVEFVPYEFNIRDDRRYGAWIERKERITPKRLECFKIHLTNSHHDYKMIGDTLYIRAYLQEDRNMMANMWRWGGDPKKDRPCKQYFGMEVRSGFSPKYTGYNSFSYFLDKLVMWNWDEPEKKK